LLKLLKCLIGHEIDEEECPKKNRKMPRQINKGTVELWPSNFSLTNQIKEQIA